MQAAHYEVSLIKIREKKTGKRKGFESFINLRNSFCNVQFYGVHFLQNKKNQPSRC